MYPMGTWVYVVEAAGRERSHVNSRHDNVPVFVWEGSFKKGGMAQTPPG